MERAHDLGLPGMWSLTMTEERELLAAADLVLCVTPEELAVVEALVPDRPARLLAYGVDPDVAGEDRGWKERAGLLYYGGFAAGAGGPNEDALSWTVDAVMPELWRTHPDLVLTVVGAEPTPAVHALASPRIHVVGGVDDPRVALRAARVLVAPVRFGAGLKLRFVDAMACGLPFVTTTVGAEGFDLGDERALLVAESASGLADAIRRLYDDEDVWTRARARVAALFRRDFTRERFGASVTAIFTEIGLLPQSTTGP
jgi:glycosyltransferase involved in cell wall biosynthesis